VGLVARSAPVMLDAMLSAASATGSVMSGAGCVEQSVDRLGLTRRTTA